jgi:hypothetical protein
VAVLLASLRQTEWPLRISLLCGDSRAIATSMAGTLASAGCNACLLKPHFPERSK